MGSPYARTQVLEFTRDDGHSLKLLQDQGEATLIMKSPDSTEDIQYPLSGRERRVLAAALYTWVKA